jgi:hypothetical protein
MLHRVVWYRAASGPYREWGGVKLGRVLCATRNQGKHILRGPAPSYLSQTPIDAVAEGERLVVAYSRSGGTGETREHS